MLTIIGNGVHFAACAEEGSKWIYKVPVQVILGKRGSVSHSRGALNRLLERVGCGIKYSQWTPDKERRVLYAGERIKTIGDYNRCIACFDMQQETKFKLLIRGEIIEYIGFAIKQEKLIPFETIERLPGLKDYVKRVYEINTMAWSHGVAFYKYAELLGWHNHGMSPNGCIKLFDFIDITEDLEFVCKRVGRRCEKFNARVNYLAKRLSKRFSREEVDYFIDYCYENYRGENIRNIWRSACREARPNRGCKLNCVTGYL